MPPLGMLFAWMVLGEHVETRDLLGIVPVALGIYLVRVPPRGAAAQEGGSMNSLRITLIGGPTALIEIEGFRLLTDPTFDAPGDYQLPHVKLEKLTGPALSAERSARSMRCCSATTSTPTISTIPARISWRKPPAC